MQHKALTTDLAKLSPRDAAWLADTFARNKARFGGWSMKDDGGDGGDSGDADKGGDSDGSGNSGKDAAGKGGDSGDGAADKPLGVGGEKALKAERDARKAMEADLAEFKKTLAAAFGVKTEDDATKSATDTLADVQQQIADMKHENAVLALANEHRITDKDDLDLLRGTRDADALNKLAARLAKPADDNKDDRGGQGGRRPKPDSSQGSGGGDGGAKSVAQVMADRAAARAAKSKS